jgi:2-polyprenyl-3-methyl-5-hydroxy-6-metoxy-1,4-benzoquinol methylase
MSALAGKRILSAWTAILSICPLGWRTRFLLKMFRRTGLDLIDISHPVEDQTRSALNEILNELTEFLKLGDAAASNPGRLKLLLRMDNQVYGLISAYARTFDNGLHPKHRLTGYHDFFRKNVGSNESVLDIGCGNGFLTSDIATSTSGRVVGVDKNAANIEFARAHYAAENTEFVCGDVTSDMRLGEFDVVVLSNVLEHLPDRVRFLQKIQEAARPSEFLIRVPMYEREWMTPLKQELGIEYRLDATHVTEYTQKQLVEELAAAGLTISHLEIKWGEFWLCAHRGNLTNADEQSRQ